MEIEKYKYIGNGKYKVYINKEEYIIYEDIIIQNNILSKKNISKDELNNYMEDNKFYEAYYKSIKYINTKLRSKKEIKNYLIKYNYNEKLIENVIDKLIKDNYLNETLYIKSYINDKINLKMIGPLKIKKELEELGFKEEKIDKQLLIFSPEIEKEKIMKLINKEIKLNKNKSLLNLKQKILITLKQKGFSNDLIIESIKKISFNDKEIYEKEYKKIYEKLSKKYSGKELEYKVKQKMYEKGFINK